MMTVPHQERAICGLCFSCLYANEALLDYTRYGLGYTNPECCVPAAPEIAISMLAEEWGLDPVDCQCLHGVGRKWTHKEFERHDRRECNLQGRMPREQFDHPRMWRVREESVWAPYTEPGRTLLTSEPYATSLKPIADDSSLWTDLGYRLDIHVYDGTSIHHPAVDSPFRTILHVATRPSSGDTPERRRLRMESSRRQGCMECHA
jgi:hypothetical protein